MKKLFCLIIILNCSFLFAHEHSFSVEPFFNYNHDTLTYSVYDGTTLNSQLDWNAFYLFKVGAQATLNYNNFVFVFSNAIALPFQSGNMYDSDWYTPNLKTDFSKSDLNTNFCYDFNIDLKYRFELPGNYFILPVLSFNYSYSSLKATNTIAWCGDMEHVGGGQDYAWDSEYAVTVKKFGIDFYNNIYVFYLGVEIGKKWENFSLSASAAIAPYIFVSFIDHHLNDIGGRQFLHLQEAFFKASSFDVCASYFINQNNKLSLSPAFAYCPEIMGVFYRGTKKNKDAFVEQPCSFNYNKLSLKLSWEFTF